MADSWYKVGDKVTIRSDLAKCNLFPFGKNEQMIKMAGKVLTINGVEKAFSLLDTSYEGKEGDGYKYHLVESIGNWNIFMFDNDKSKALNTSRAPTDSKTINIKVTKPTIKLNFKL